MIQCKYMESSLFSRFQMIPKLFSMIHPIFRMLHFLSRMLHFMIWNIKAGKKLDDFIM